MSNWGGVKGEGVTCNNLRQLLENFSKKDQFHLVREFSSPQEANEGTMNVIRNLAKKHGLDKKIRFTPGKAPPHAFIYPKNKSEEEIKLIIYYFLTF